MSMGDVNILYFFRYFSRYGKKYKKSLNLYMIWKIMYNYIILIKNYKTKFPLNLQNNYILTVKMSKKMTILFN
jgi:hypothetical protein